MDSLNNDQQMQTELIGLLLTGGTPEFIHLTLHPDASLDRPNTYRFHLPMQNESQPPEFHLRADGLELQGQVLGRRITGSAQDGETSGAFELFALYPLTPSEYSAWIGSYRFPGGKEIMFSQDVRSEGPLYFYLEGRQVVRLYPIGPDNLYSERNELFTFHHRSETELHALTCQPYGRNPVSGHRIDMGPEQMVEIPVDDYLIAGTLLLPSGPGPFPAVMLCHHADTHLRDYYRIFAAPFVRHGIAVLIYDKRGWGGSTGDSLFSQIHALSEDAGAVFRFLQSHPAIQPARIGFWGISNGAWVAPLAASHLPETAFVISMSAAGVTPARQEQFRRANVAGELGASPRAIALIEGLWELLFQFYIDGQWNTEVEAILKQVYADEELQRLPKHPEHGPMLQPVPPTLPFEEIRSQIEDGLWKDGGFDPAPVYGGLRCPVLCVWGEQDTVVPLQESVQRIENALRERSAPYELRFVPSATHKLYLVPPEPTGLLAEVMHTHLHNVTLAPDVLEQTAEWALRCISGE